MQDEKTRLAILKSYQMIRSLKPLANKNMSSLVSNLRRFIRENTTIDPYMSRDSWRRWEPSKNKCVRIEIGNMSYHRSEFVYAKNVWKDDYAHWLRNPERLSLHDRNNEFRINDEYFFYSEYFEYEGKAYDKKEYVLYEGKPIEKSRVSICNYYIYPPQGGGAQKKEIALMPQDDEVFVRHNVNKDNTIVAIDVGINCYRQALFCEQFVKSMFCIGNERESLDDGKIYITPEQLKIFKFKPMASHVETFAKAKNLSSEVAMDEMMKELEKTSFYIYQPNPQKSTSLKQKLLNIIVKNRPRRSYTDACVGLKELFIRLRAISKMNDVEVQYAK